MKTSGNANTDKRASTSAPISVRQGYHESIRFTDIEESWNTKLTKEWVPGKDYLSLYIDAPFCLRRCSYCCYFRAEGRISSEEFRRYFWEDLPRLIDLYKTVLDRAPITVCCFGGGTANLMTTEIMTHIFDRIPHFAAIPLKKMEGHPALFSKEKIDLLCDYEFTDISVGIQTFNKSLLSKFNRIPLNVKRTRSIIDYAMRKGLRVNCDLLVFADTQALADLETLESDLLMMASEFHPGHITVYPWYQLFSASRNEHVIEQRDALINKIAHLRCTLLNFVLQCPDYLAESPDFKNLTVIAAFNREEISKHLTTCYRISRLSAIEQQQSFMYNSDYFYDEEKYSGQRQNVIGLGGGTRVRVHSYICGTLYYLTSIDDGNIYFHKRSDCLDSIPQKG